MDPETYSIRTYTGYILDEVFYAFGFSRSGLARRIFWPLFWPVARGFAGIVAGLDQDIGRLGLSQAAKHVLDRFVDQVAVHGHENIPESGPLLVACNHPGAFDAFAAVACLGRDDLKLVVSEVSLFKTLPAVDAHMIYTYTGAHGRMNTLRAAIRHLESGGAVFIFPTGLVDPDPDVLPGAEEALGRWSESLELMLRRVPQARLLATIVSGVLAPAAFRNPLVRLRKQPWDQRKLAEFIQVMTQFVFPKRYKLAPRISFALPVTLDELREQSLQASSLQASSLLAGSQERGSVMAAIIAHAGRLLEEHNSKRPLPEISPETR